MAPAVGEPAPSSASPRLSGPLKNDKQKKSAEAPALDAQAPAVPGVNLQFGLPLTLEAGRGQARPEISSGRQADAALSTALPVPASAAGNDLQVEWNHGRNPSSPGELAFALRLKPLAAVAIAATPGAPTLPAAHAPETKTGEAAMSVPGGLAAGQSSVESGADPEGGNGNEDSARGEVATHKTAPADQPERDRHTEKTETPTPLESTPRHAPEAESHATPLAPAAPGPAAPKTAAPPAAMPAATSLDAQDRPVQSRPAQEISLQISSGGDHKVDVRLVERAGEVHISVRTPDVTLARELRQDLGSLTGKLAQGGFATEQFTPAGTGSSSLSDQRPHPEQQDASRGHDPGSQDRGSGQQQQQQPPDERGKPPAWVEELDHSLAQRQTHRSTQWLLNR